MKKLIIGVLALIFILVAAVYVFIPNTIRISASTSINASHSAATRVLADEKQWKAWWPEKATIANLHFDGSNYTMSKNMFQSFLVNIEQGGTKLESLVVLLPIRSDSFRIEWKTNFNTGYDPFSRYKHYKEARQLENNLEKLLSSFRSFMEQNKNIYGTSVRQTMVSDSIILVSTASIKTFPTVDEVYQHVRKLKNFAAQQGAREKNYPMLNVHQDGQTFFLRVGLPIDKEVPVDGSALSIKKMVRGYLLVTEVKGGHNAISNAIAEVEQYMIDYKRRSPAIPYESLVTDRSAEPDSTKWVTRIYYPVY